MLLKAKHVNNRKNWASKTRVYLDSYYGIAGWMPHFDYMATRPKTKLPQMLEVMNTAVVFLVIHRDYTGEFDNFLESGFNFSLF